MQVDNNEICFLCKRAIDATDEHIFPKWLQNRFNLWNETIVLKNGSRIRYKDLKIPCCVECNTKHLSQIEATVSTLLNEENIPGLIAETDSLFIWLYKMMFGINYKEIFLSNDRGQANSPKIVSDESLASRTAYNWFLRYVRKEVVFDGFSPYSLFIFRLTDSTPTTYYYMSEPYTMFASVIIGNIGIVASFQDDGCIARDIERSNFLNGLTELSKPQFGDFSAFVLHLKSRMKLLPDYVVTLEKERLVFRTQGAIEGSLYSPFTLRKQIELTQQCFNYCFEGLIKENEVYWTPFKYF